jgi:hypothetical protein
MAKNMWLGLLILPLLQGAEPKTTVSPDLLKLYKDLETALDSLDEKGDLSSFCVSRTVQYYSPPRGPPRFECVSLLDGDIPDSISEKVRSFVEQLRLETKEAEMKDAIFELS